MSDKKYMDMCDFIANNPTAFHVAAGIAAHLEKAGFSRLYESDKWELKAGGKHYVMRNDSSIIAFEIGKKSKSSYSFNIVASHTDSPCFKLKENAVVASEKYTKLNTEGYGGMILNTWLDRPLSVAGRVVVKSSNGVKSLLFDAGRDLLIIPNVAIHMNPDINNGYKYSRQTDMLPIISLGKKEEAVRELIVNTLSRQQSEADVLINKADILGYDLCLYNRCAPSNLGMDKELIAAPRLDDQECVYTSMAAFTEAMAECGSINICACFDNEEVGSGTKQGASSTFLSDVMERIAAGIGLNAEDYRRALASSFMLSADNAHAVHPNHPEHTDQTNGVYMNAGVVVKSHAGQKYTSDGVSIAVLKAIAGECGVPLQFYSNNSDKAGGSTLGNLSTHQVSIKAVDIGLAQLAMHSSYETAGALDVDYMIQLMKAFYGKHFEENAEGLCF